MPKKSINSDTEGEDGENAEDGEYAPVEFSHFPDETSNRKKPKISIEFPLKLKNLFFEHYSNPWSIYISVLFFVIFYIYIYIFFILYFFLLSI